MQLYIFLLLKLSIYLFLSDFQKEIDVFIFGTKITRFSDLLFSKTKELLEVLV